MVRSNAEIWIWSMVCGVGVFLGTLAIKWMIYDWLLHQDGLRFVGSAISGVSAATWCRDPALPAHLEY